MVQQVADNQKMRRRAMADPRLEQRARRFVADAKAREERDRSKGGDAPKLSARARLRRAVIVTKFAGRAIQAAKEAAEAPPVADLTNGHIVEPISPVQVRISAISLVYQLTQISYCRRLRA